MLGELLEYFNSNDLAELNSESMVSRVCGELEYCNM